MPLFYFLLQAIQILSNKKKICLKFILEHRCIGKSQSATLKGRDRLLIDSNNLIHFLLESVSSDNFFVNESCEAPKSKCLKSTHAVRFRTRKDHYSRLGAYTRPRRSFKRKRLLINQI
ncbi:hypothetical protein Peur_069712 [Populus x canadensis]